MTVPPGATDWIRRLADALVWQGTRTVSEAEADAAAFARRVPVAYLDQTTALDAAGDMAELSSLSRRSAADAAEGALRRDFGRAQQLAVRVGSDVRPDMFRLRRFGFDALELTGFLPVLESFGLAVTEALPYHVGSGTDGEPMVHIEDFGLRVISAPVDDPRFHPTSDGDRLVDAIEAVAHGDTEIDSLNRLVIAARMTWRQVVVVRAYRRYLRHAGSVWTDRQLDDSLVAYPAVAVALLEFFRARFDPAGAPGADAVESARSRVLAALSGVAHLDEDQVLRTFLGLMEATVRTSHYARDASGRPLATIALKLDSTRVPDLPAPRPHVETFVHAGHVEGLHLRAGPVARGGIRWSDRHDDLRTEVLDLAEAQVKKNAIIVPTGAKGGFVCRGSAEITPEVIRARYEAFIRALLDVTDNVVDGAVHTPAGVRAYDGDDPYLVVAADRGTASFSDLANHLSAEYEFWLGDAFASGGSQGYDHKAMGITAKGAWIAARRHFRLLGMDVQTDAIRVVGIGDMSGDVFGNGMLQSQAIRLVAAFDHRHVFLDPDPDPALSYQERRRLYDRPGSSWDDYDRAALSNGGGVWRRDAKQVDVAQDARTALGLGPGPLSPPRLISGLLRAPVDLLWFGGIGTYIKAPGESDSEVGDHANDGLRVTADEVRARVIVEGGNLGVTQRARIRYSRRGGRINTDFIDNAAGVATSDREVNLKILMALAIGDGRLDPAERDGVLAAAEGDVAGDVLRQVDHSIAALTRAVPHSADDLDAYVALLDTLECDGRFDRSVESLPDNEELGVRRAAGAGLIRPELAVLLAYAKSDLITALEASTALDDPALAETVIPYFPPAISARFADLIPRHRLYRQLAATDLAGEVVDHMGIVWAHETAAELGRPVQEVAVAVWAARQVLDAGNHWGQVEALAPGVPAEVELALHRAVTDAVGALARSYLTRAVPLDAGRLIALDRPLVAVAGAVLTKDDGAGDGDGGAASAFGKELVDRAVAAGVPAETVIQLFALRRLASVGDIRLVSEATQRPVPEVGLAFATVEEVLGLNQLSAGVRSLLSSGHRSRWSRWQARALLDDMDAVRRQAVTVALSDHGATAAVEAVRAWERRAALPLTRARRLLDQFTSRQSPAPSTLRADAEGDDALSLAALAVRATEQACGSLGRTVA